MKPNDRDQEFVSSFAPGGVDATLRLVASLPAPEGLEDRIHEAFQSAPRTARILDWPASLRPGSAWMRSGAMRSAAAAAIVFIVAGGGWGVYSRVQPSKVMVMPPRVAAPSGFSGAGAIRTPQTLKGPTINRPVTPPARLKTPGRAASIPLHRPGQTASADKATAQPAAPPVQ